jgi:hypothetical protein
MVPALTMQICQVAHQFKDDPRSAVRKAAHSILKRYDTLAAPEKGSNAN